VHRLAAVVPATDSPPTLQRCIDALLAAEEPPDEVIVVEQPRRVSPAAARNLGVSRTAAELIVFVDSDVVVARDAFVRVREHFERDPELAAVFRAYDDTVATARLPARFRNLLHHHVHSRAGGYASTFWAGIGAVRRDAFELAGGFDEQRYARPSIEDVELGTRLADQGARVLLDPAIRGTHLKEWTAAQMVKTDFADRGVPWVVLLLDRREVPTTLNLGWRERGSAIAAVVSAISVARGRPVRAGLSGAILIALNYSLYGLLVRRLGVAATVACIPLHVAHHLTAVASVPGGVVAYVIGHGLNGGAARAGSRS
jgi:glycosyltransferase involved in cell wall biosynthesis